LRDLTQDDMEVAEASVRFAMENCPVEGLLSKEDGTSISLDEMQSILEKLQEAEKTPGFKIGGEVALTLKSVIDYTSENCPVEGVAVFHDGRPISGKDIMTLDEKLREQGRE
jgi:hypothetical protein